MNKTVVLVVEDDRPIRNLIVTTLKMHDYKYLTANNGVSAIMEASSHHPDIVLLDLGLPDMEGVDVIKKIRTWSNMPIIVISARSEDKDKIDALDAGADDYLTKPFMSEELLARIRGCLRRNNITNKEVFESKGLKVNFALHQVFVDDVEIHLTPLEFKMLSLFINNKERVLTHKYIQKEVWGYDSLDEYQSLRVFILNLRRKLCINNHNYIHTEIGIGYRIII